MTIDQVNLLNIALMIASAAAAFALPFQLFLAAYAVLGPLHYLTQISWLHSRGYFTTDRRDYLLLGALAAALLTLRYVAIGVMYLDAMPWATAVVFVALAASYGMAFFPYPAVKLVLVGAALVLAPWVATADTAQVLLLSLLPTIIHVYCFTAIFILHGALRGRSASGIASFVVFAACTASFFVFRTSDAGPVLGGYLRDSYDHFASLNVHLADWLGLASLEGPDAVYASSTGVVLMRFIAFAYTYHYLNWFSKTSVIQWHKVPRAWAVTNIVLWIGSVGLYAWDYATGVIVLFSLSWLHVLLELPLDYWTLAGVGRELAALRVIAPGSGQRMRVP